MELRNHNLVLGIEGSANKIAVGIVGYDGRIYANIRKTHISQAGKGFIPRETQKHHAEFILQVLESALLHAYSTIFPNEVVVTSKSHRWEKRSIVQTIVSKISCLCFTKGPGMAGCLGIGATIVRVLTQLWGKKSKHFMCNEEKGTRSSYLKNLPVFANIFYSPVHPILPIVGVNHCVAHIEMGRLVCNIQPTCGVHSAFIQTKSEGAESNRSVVVLYVSGGNTQIITYSAHQYKILGETVDIAVGNCIDRLGRMLRISNSPCAGANIEKLARVGRQRWEKGRKNPTNTDEKESNFLPLPYVLKGVDMSFSGLLSYCGELIKHHFFDQLSTETHPARDIIDEVVAQNQESSSKANIDISRSFDIYDLCWSVEEHIFASLVEATERALCLARATDVLIVGGVGCNIRLQEMMRQMVAQRNVRVSQSCEKNASSCTSHDMDERYCIDNGCMIAYTGALEHLAYMRNRHYSKANPDSVACLLEKVTVCQRYRTDDVYVSWYDV